MENNDVESPTLSSFTTVSGVNIPIFGKSFFMNSTPLVEIIAWSHVVLLIVISKSSPTFGLFLFGKSHKHNNNFFAALNSNVKQRRKTIVLLWKENITRCCSSRYKSRCRCCTFRCRSRRNQTTAMHEMVLE